MPYVDRTCYDADSHIMELQDWLAPYADPAIRDRIRPLYLGGAGKLAERAVDEADRRRDDPEAARALEENVMGPKGWSALGAFDPRERSRALDLLGFDKQLVFSTFAATQFMGDDAELLWGGTRALNRAMADFCSDDKRMVAVGMVPLHDASRASAEAAAAIDLGCGAILVASAPQGENSPAHSEYDPLWRLLEERCVPFMLHIGGGGRTLPKAFHHNGKPKTTDFLGGGENIRSKDYMVIHMAPEMMLSCMALDGVFERFAGLRGGCIEQGAMWVVPWLKRLDIAQETFQRTEPALKLPMRASEYIRRSLKFTPFPTEPVGWMIEQAGEELFLFSSDYPHPEGGRNPLARFEASMQGTPEPAKQRFYADNFARMMSLA